MKAEQIERLAQAAANKVMGHLEGERIIPRFIDSYVMGFDRPALKMPVEAFNQRSQEIGRQALLLLGRLVVEKCGARFRRFKLGPLALADKGAAGRFAEQFWPKLTMQLKLSPQRATELARQAEDYTDAERRETLFAGRVAPLLDPAPHMRDKAEHAGQKFYQALDSVASQVAARLFVS
ncbi:MAG: hypothetical protein ACE5HB_07490 [Terriglobia bacterium]